ncbi:putative Tim10/DDP family zinc finger containing protein [Leishmania naiffi]|uniref:Tim10/DDP family zinc finger containing protein n=1 Tax=Leishmania naiffi TaxID=5678 RepID=A0AAW3C781_9TRYP
MLPMQPSVNLTSLLTPHPFSSPGLLKTCMPARRVCHSRVATQAGDGASAPSCLPPLYPTSTAVLCSATALACLPSPSLRHSPERSIDFLSPIMQAQMMLGQALEHYTMMDFANLVLEQCWDICYDSQLTRPELAGSELPDVKVQKMDACARKCVARHFEVLSLLSATRELREKERMQGLAPGTLTSM